MKFQFILAFIFIICFQDLALADLFDGFPVMYSELQERINHDKLKLDDVKPIDSFSDAEINELIQVSAKLFFTANPFQSEISYKLDIKKSIIQNGLNKGLFVPLTTLLASQIDLDMGLAVQFNLHVLSKVNPNFVNQLNSNLNTNIYSEKTPDLIKQLQDQEQTVLLSLERDSKFKQFINPSELEMYGGINAKNSYVNTVDGFFSDKPLIGGPMLRQVSPLRRLYEASSGVTSIFSVSKRIQQQNNDSQSSNNFLQPDPRYMDGESGSTCSTEVLTCIAGQTAEALSGVDPNKLHEIIKGKNIVSNSVSMVGNVALKIASYYEGFGTVLTAKKFVDITADYAQGAGCFASCATGDDAEAIKNLSQINVRSSAAENSLHAAEVATEAVEDENKKEQKDKDDKQKQKNQDEENARKKRQEEDEERRKKEEREAKDSIRFMNDRDGAGSAPVSGSKRPGQVMTSEVTPLHCEVESKIELCARALEARCRKYPMIAECIALKQILNATEKTSSFKIINETDYFKKYHTGNIVVGQPLKNPSLVLPGFNDQGLLDSKNDDVDLLLEDNPSTKKPSKKW